MIKANDMKDSSEINTEKKERNSLKVDEISFFPCSIALVNTYVDMYKECCRIFKITK
jgi:hypothetical protein